MPSASSNQPRFKAGVDPADFFATIVRAFSDDDPAPVYSTDSRKLDLWLARFVKREPHLAGVLNSVATIDKNRGWSVTGGRNQVNRVTDMLHNFECAPGLIGWRPAFGYASKSFWGTNMGAVIELGTDGVNGPVRKLYNTDPTKCVLSGDPKNPLWYYPPGQKRQKWASSDFFRVISVTDIDETFNGLGESAIYRAVGIAELMVALIRHNAEQLLARAPRGLLLLQGIRKEQWDAAMASNDVELNASEMKYFGALAVLASASEKVDAKLLALSQLPQAYNHKDWMDMTMYGYSLCFGYDASEFWPVQYGALGRGNETQIQHEKATAKGRLDFVLGFQEQIQNCLPNSVDFAVEQRDDQGDLLHASVVQAWSDVAKTLYESKDSTGVPLVTNEEARVLLSDYGVIPSTWSPTTEVHSTDVDEADMDPQVDPGAGPESQPKQLPSGTQGVNPVSSKPMAQSLAPRFSRMDREAVRDALMQSPRIIRAAEKFLTDPIVRYDYSTAFPRGRITTLWESGESLLSPKPQFRVSRVMRGKDEEEEDKTIVVQPNIVINIPELNGANQQALHFERPGKYTVERDNQKLDITIPQPVFNVAMPAPEITVNIPERRALDALVDPNVQIQAQPNIIFSPIINVPTPEVNIENTVYVPEPKRETVIVKRDNTGKISRVEKVIADE